MNKGIIVAALAVSAATLCEADEVVLFDNLQWSFNSGSWWEVDAVQSIANPFSSSVYAVLSEVRLALMPTTTLDQPNFYTVSITDALAGLPGPNTLYQWTNVQGSYWTVLTFASDVAVTPGGSYFVKVEAANQATQGGLCWSSWNGSNQFDSGPFAYNRGGPWLWYDTKYWYERRGGMTVKATLGEPVPEPATVALAGLALGLAARRRRNR